MNSNELDFNIKDSVHWLPFEKQTVAEAPREDGVYILRQAGGKLFGRLRGSSDILYVGSSTCKGGLRQRLSHYFHPGPTQWTNLRINRYLGKYMMEVVWLPTSNPLNLEHKLLTRYIEDHDEQPPFNHADTRRFQSKTNEAATFSDSLRVKKVEGKQ
jgi:hypothetical protein